VTVPILEGRLGTVRVGVWKDEVDAEIAAAVAPLVKWIAWAVIGGVFAAIVLVWKINQPIIRLVRAAREISHGELDSPGPGIADSTEYGELSRALERMRASVRAAMVRLNGEI
jgi:HAMP domain-containing protein